MPHAKVAASINQVGNLKITAQKFPEHLFLEFKFQILWISFAMSSEESHPDGNDPSESVQSPRSSYSSQSEEEPVPLNEFLLGIGEAFSNPGDNDASHQGDDDVGPFAEGHGESNLLGFVTRLQRLLSHLDASSEPSSSEEGESRTAPDINLQRYICHLLSRSISRSLFIVLF